jgi:ABC-type multidrug transport system ATPase subunit
VGAKGEIYRLLNELAHAGKSIIMISSELPEVLRMSHRIVVMCEGRVTGELSCTEATQEGIMRLATQRSVLVADADASGPNGGGLNGSGTNGVGTGGGALVPGNTAGAGTDAVTKKTLETQGGAGPSASQQS